MPKNKLSLNCKSFLREEVAKSRYEKGEQFSCSTFIDEDTIIAGYGKLDMIGFKYPLPFSIITKEFGTLSWKEHHILNNRKENLNLLLK